jgi:N12 class adenine-specific DNA methylase
MEATWAILALDGAQKSLGHSAYARQKAAMYRKRAERAQALITAVGYGDLLAPDASIIERVQQERDQELKFVADAVSVK